MNKLASIYFLQSLGLPTISPELIESRDEEQVRKTVNYFYRPNKLGWVIRCGRPPSKEGKVERGLPWDSAQDEEELIIKILKIQKEVGSGYLIFCHPRFELIRGASMLIEGDRVVVESATGNFRELSAFYRGYRSPQQRIVFKPGMFSSQKFGEEVLLPGDLLDLRKIERIFNWQDIGEIHEPIIVELSWLEDGSLYVHDVCTVY